MADDGAHQEVVGDDHALVAERVRRRPLTVERDSVAGSRASSALLKTCAVITLSARPSAISAR